MARERRSGQVDDAPPEASERDARTERRPLIVVADLDPGLRLLLRQILTAAGYDVRLVVSIQDLAAVVQTGRPEGLLISASLAGDQTPALLRSIRTRSQAFILALTEGRFDVSDEYVDDSIVAPFREDELVLRVANAHRRARLRQRKALAFIHHGLLIDLTLNQVTLNGRSVSLSRLEFEVLRVLAENEGKIVGYDQILRESWRDPSTRRLGKLRHVIHLLRLKLGCDDLGRSFIVTDNRAGYGLRGRGGSSATDHDKEPKVSERNRTTAPLSKKTCR
jgi:two-component system, OmpR family, KDP operon response regulator KdpE